MAISEGAELQLKVLENQFAQDAKTRKSVGIVCGAGITLASILVSEKKLSFTWSGAIQSALLEANKLKNITTDKKKEIGEALNKISEELEKIKKGELDSLDAQQLTEFAKLAKQILVSKNRYSSWLISKFDTGLVPEPNNRDLLDAIVECSKLDKVNIATTNYDYLISKAQGWLGKADSGFTPINWLDDESLTTDWLNQTSKRVLHLHGDARNSESVIFSSDDYNLLNSDEWVKRIRNVINNNMICIFIGCGETLKDEAFTKLLNEYCAGLKRNRHSSRWFQVIMNGEDLAHGDLLPLEYGSKYSDLAPYIKNYLLPILSGKTVNKVTEERLNSKFYRISPTLGPNELTPFRQSVATIIHEQLNENKEILELFGNEKDINNVSLQFAQANSEEVQKLLEFLQKGFLNPNKYSTQGIKKIAGILVLLIILEEESLQIPDKVEEFLKINFPADIDTVNFDLCLEILHSINRHWPVNLRLGKNNLISESLVFRQEMEHPSGFESDLHIQNIALQLINEDPLSSGKNLKLPEIETVEQRRIDAGFDSKNAVNSLINKANLLLKIRSSKKRGVIIDGREGVYSTPEVQEKLQSYFKNSKMSLLVKSNDNNQIKEIIDDFYLILVQFLMLEINQNHE